MKATIHNLIEDITKAVGPIFYKVQDYDVIFPAMCCVMARVIQSTPDKGKEMLIMEDAYNEIKHALKQFIAIENEKEATKAKLDVGIADFAGFAEEKPIEPGSSGDYPDNPNQNVAKTVAPFRDQDGNLTQEGFDQLKEGVVKLHSLDDKPGIEHPFHIQEEAEQAKQDTYKEEP